MCVAKLDQVAVVDYDLVSFILTCFEEFRQGEPLACHFVSVVGVYELIVVDTVRGVSLHSLDGGFTAVESDDVVDERLTGLGQRERFRWGGGVVLRFG